MVSLNTYKHLLTTYTKLSALEIITIKRV